MYDIIYADPPWYYHNNRQHVARQTKFGNVRSEEPKLKELKRMPIGDMAADDALLYMWTTNTHLPQALQLGEAWGFNYMTVAFIWDKQRLNPGFYTLSQCDSCLVFKKNRIPQPRGSRKVRQFYSEKSGAYGKKPVEFRRRITESFPTQNKVELFVKGDVPEEETWTFMTLQDLRDYAEK